MTIRRRIRPGIRPALPAVLVLALLAAAPALAATKNGITPVAPKAGATVPVNTAPTFRLKVKGQGTVWVHVCKSKKRNAKGLICRKELIQAKRKGSTAKAKPQLFNYPGFWLQTPGTYYWQAHRIQCDVGNTADCLKEGPIVMFKVG